MMMIHSRKREINYGEPPGDPRNNHFLSDVFGFKEICIFRERFNWTNMIDKHIACGSSNVDNYYCSDVYLCEKIYAYCSIYFKIKGQV